MMKNNTSGASLFLLWTCGASLRISVLAVPPVISIIQQDLHLSGTEIGLLFGVPYILFAIAATPGSTLITRFGVRSTLLTGLAIAAIGGRCGRNFERLAVISDEHRHELRHCDHEPGDGGGGADMIPERATFGTAVYANGLIIGEIIPVATMLPLVLPHLGSWRPALGIWSIPLVGTATLVAILRPRSTTYAITSHRLLQ